MQFPRYPAMGYNVLKILIALINDGYLPDIQNYTIRGSQIVEATTGNVLYDLGPALQGKGFFQDLQKNKEEPLPNDYAHQVLQHGGYTTDTTGKPEDGKHNAQPEGPKADGCGCGCGSTGECTDTGAAHPERWKHIVVALLVLALVVATIYGAITHFSK